MRLWSRSQTGGHANRPIYAAISVSLEGEKDILGLLAGTGGDGGRTSQTRVLTEMKNRGVKDTFFLVCDGLKDPPEVVANVWSLATVQACTIFLIRNTFKVGLDENRDALKRARVADLYGTVNRTAATAALADHDEKWGKKYAAIIGLEISSWEESIPFPDDDDISKVICSTSAIESLNALCLQSVLASGYLHTEPATETY